PAARSARSATRSARSSERTTRSAAPNGVLEIRGDIYLPSATSVVYSLAFVSDRGGAPMNITSLNRRQASSALAFLAYGEVARSGVLEPMRFPARTSSG